MRVAAAAVTSRPTTKPSSSASYTHARFTGSTTNRSADTPTIVESRTASEDGIGKLGVRQGRDRQSNAACIMLPKSASATVSVTPTPSSPRIPTSSGLDTICAWICRRSIVCVMERLGPTFANAASAGSPAVRTHHSFAPVVGEARTLWALPSATTTKPPGTWPGYSVGKACTSAPAMNVVSSALVLVTRKVKR